MKRKTLISKMNRIAKNASKRVTNTVGTAMAAVPILKSKYKQYKTGLEAKHLKETRKYKDMPDFIDGKPSDGLKMRTVAEGIKMKYNKKRK
jgi:hypothetical protein